MPRLVGHQIAANYDAVEALLRREALTVPEVATEMDWTQGRARTYVRGLVEAGRARKAGSAYSGAATYVSTHND